jgi:orotidine-5'-phosphate decarboxylase
MRSRLIFALDVGSVDEAMKLIDLLTAEVGMFKVGKQLFVHAGPQIVRLIRERGGEVFLDLKFHDIPSVVGKAVEKAVAEDVHYVTVHASGGRAMIRAAVDAAAGSRAKVLAVTVLTSLDLVAWREGASPSEESVEAAVRRLARLAVDAGAHGLVGSARETALLRAAGGKDCVIVTPGISVGAGAADQARTATVEEAIAGGADILVVGRGVLRADDPAAVLRAIQAKLAQVPA